MKEEQFQQQQLEGMPITAEAIKKNFETKRINPDLSFGNLYSTYQDDMDRASRLNERYEQQSERDELDLLGEAIVFASIEKGALGEKVTARGTSMYDDFFHGADIVIESKARQIREPIISSIDVTVGQQAPGAVIKSAFEVEGMVYEVGLEKKLERIKRHIDILAGYSNNDAIEVSAWLQSGGLSQSRNKQNERYFDKAEKLMLLKYYKNPHTSDDPDKPHFVIAGPQIVVSLDRAFVNKVFNSNQQDKAIKDINTLIQVEVPFAIGAITEYVDTVAKRKGQTNLLLDMMRVACRA